MRTGIAIITATLVCVAGQGMGSEFKITSNRGLQHFSPEVLTARVGDPISPLKRLRLTDLAPEEVALHIKDSRYVGATLRFQKTIEVEDAIESIQRTFAQCKQVSEQTDGTTRSWKDEATGFTITMVEGEDYLEVKYTGIKPPRKLTFKDLPETQLRVNLKSF